MVDDEWNAALPPINHHDFAYYHDWQEENYERRSVEQIVLASDAVLVKKDLT